MKNKQTMHTNAIEKTIFGLLMSIFAFAIASNNLLIDRCVADDEWLEPAEVKERVEKTLGEPKDCKRLLPDSRIWFNRDEQAVIVDGYICQRQALLEMFACPIGTKEHESIVAVYGRSKYVHAALLAVGAKQGKPASFEPFQPATGSTIRVYALWFDADGKPQATIAQNWIRRAGTEKCMEWDWVFAGSRIYKDESTGHESYLADGGELVCVANFVTSTLDVSVRSDAANSDLVFDSFTERIPKRDTPIRLVLVLSDEEPFTNEDSQGEKRAAKHLTDKVPDHVLRFLTESKKAKPEAEKPAEKPAKSAKEEKPKATTPQATKESKPTPPSKPKP